MAQPPCKRPRSGDVDGVTDFEKGQRDFTPQAPDSKAICADFSSKTKQYTNGTLAKNLGSKSIEEVTSTAT